MNPPYPLSKGEIPPTPFAKGELSAQGCRNRPRPVEVRGGWFGRSHSCRAARKAIGWRNGGCIPWSCRHRNRKRGTPRHCRAAATSGCRRLAIRATAFRQAQRPSAAGGRQPRPAAKTMLRDNAVSCLQKYGKNGRTTNNAKKESPKGNSLRFRPVP